MKLYLSSYGLGNQVEKLQQMVGGNRRAAIVMNAHDPYDVVSRAERLNRESENLQHLGFVSEELDLREYFDKQDMLEARLRQYDLLWIKGGNAFVLRKAMHQSGFDKVIKPLLLENKLVYAGYSAACCVAGKTLHGIELCDDPTAIPQGYEQGVLWEGLGLIDYSIAPHYKSDHPESEMIDSVVDYFDEHAMSYKALRDGDVIVIDEIQE